MSAGSDRPSSSSGTDHNNNPTSSSQRPLTVEGPPTTTRRNAASFIPKTSFFTRSKPSSVSSVNSSGIPVSSKSVFGGVFSKNAAKQQRNIILLKDSNAGDKFEDKKKVVKQEQESFSLFGVKSDTELDSELDAALQKSISMIGAADNEEIECCEGHPSKWKEFFDNNVLCDCTIQANDGKTFQAHRCILAASCPFFYQKCCKEKQHKIVLRTVDSSTLKSIIDFVYTGEFSKSVEIVSKMLPVAQKFKMVSILQQCCAFLLENMKSENALRIYSFAKPHFCTQLESKAKSFILNNFRSVIKTGDFLDLDSSGLKEILKDDHLNARNEAMVFEAIRSWVEHNPVKRRKNIPELLSCVRFGLMSYGYFTNVVYQWHFVEEDDSVRRALEGPSVLLTSIDSMNNSEVDLNDPLARPRIPYEVIFAVGGWSAGSPTAFVETYDIRADRWFLLNNTDSTPRAYHGLVALGQFVYMIGGFDGQEHFSTVKRYDPVAQIWEERSCMLFPRCYVSCCELSDIIYACGGYNGRTRMSSCEKYLPERNQWEMISAMNRQRSDASCSSLKGKVYIAGGFTGTEVLSSVETYDPKEDQWTFIQPMNTARSGVSLVSYRDCLYAVGGFNGFNRLNTAERYDPEDPSPWAMIPDMSSSRSNFAAVCADELLICIGGFNGATTIPYVECYDSKVNEWFDASHMNLNRSALSACVVPNLSNAREYSYLHRISELLGISN